MERRWKLLAQRRRGAVVVRRPGRRVCDGARRSGVGDAGGRQAYQERAAVAPVLPATWASTETGLTPGKQAASWTVNPAAIGALLSARLGATISAIATSRLGAAVSASTAWSAARRSALTAVRRRTSTCSALRRRVPSRCMFWRTTHDDQGVPFPGAHDPHAVQRRT